MAVGVWRAGGSKRAMIIIAVLGIALAVRLHGIAFESFWADEVISFNNSSGSLGEVLETNGRMARPPLYYAGLHFWRTLVHDSDGRIRAYSTLWSLIGLLALLLLAYEMAGWNAALIALLLAAVNPFDVFLAQEARNYSQTNAFCTLSSWCLWCWIATSSRPPRDLSWWPWALGYSICAAAAILSHYLAVPVLAAQGLFGLGVFVRRRRWSRAGGYVAATLTAILITLPWFIYVYSIEYGLRLRTPGWMQVPDSGSWLAFLGREFFWGCNWRAHDRWWVCTLLLAVSVLGICLSALRKNWRADTAVNGAKPTAIVYALWMVAIPIVLAVTVSWLYHPVYHRPRFALLVLPPFLVLSAVACRTLRPRVAGWALAAAMVAVMAAGTAAQEYTIEKTDWRRLAKVWEEQGTPDAAVFIPAFLEETANYYLKKPAPHCPENEVERWLPRTPGATLWVCSWKGYRQSEREANYFHWLCGLGNVRGIPVCAGLHLDVITLGKHSVPEAFRDRFDQWHAPRDGTGRIAGFDVRERFHLLEFDADQSAFRWSQPTAWVRLDVGDNAATVVLNVELPPPALPNYRPDLKCFAARSPDGSGLLESSPVLQIPDYRAGSFDVALPVPQGPGPLWLGWTLNGVNLKRAGAANDDRDFGLKIHWLGVQNRRP